MRPALEDQIGAGAILSALHHQQAGPFSPEASATRALYETIDDIGGLVMACASGRELAHAGFADDVTIATEINTSDTVPARTTGAFTAAVWSAP
jgi:2-phosphosulfolactate phosphatase